MGKWCIATSKDESRVVLCVRFVIHPYSLRWNYPDQVLGSVAAATLSACRTSKLPFSRFQVTALRLAVRCRAQ